MGDEQMAAADTDRDGLSASRRRAFIDAASHSFFANGYGSTTMSSIARTVGGSKTTLWSYFPSKEALFAGVVDDIVDKYGEALSFELTHEEDVRETLRYFAEVLVRTLLSDPILTLFRMVVAGTHRFPDLAALFYERGPTRGKAKLEAFIREAMIRGSLRDGDAEIAVQQFVGLCQSGLYQLALLGLADENARNRLSYELDAAVDSFYRAWRPDPRD